MKQKVLNVYIKFNKENPTLSHVCRQSILDNSTIPVNVIYLDADDLADREILLSLDDQNYREQQHRLKFFVPYLNNYQDWAVYVDDNVIFVDDVDCLLNEKVANKTIQTVKQKSVNLNSCGVVIWNCKSARNSILDLEYINTSSLKQLNEACWAKNINIGSIPVQWDWKVNWHRAGRDGEPKAINYGNFSPNDRVCEYADEWHYYLESIDESHRIKPVLPEHLTVCEPIQDLIKQFYALKTDPTGLFHQHSLEDFVKKLNYENETPELIAVLDGADEEESETVIMKEDKILENFVLGTNGIVGRMDLMDTTPPDIPITLRGITKYKVMKKCVETGRDYYYVDTGYFGNDKRKNYHRVTRNAMQYFGPLDPECPDDRFVRTRTSLSKHRGGTNILLCPPSEKAMRYWGLDLQEWLTITIGDIKKYTDRPVVIREKQSRRIRTEVDTMALALSRDVHCLVTFNSIAAVEGLIYGKPVFTMGPNAAQPLANTDIKKIENPYMPTQEEIRNLMCNLAYQQFTVPEMRNGTAWKMMQEWREHHGDSVIK